MESADDDTEEEDLSSPTKGPLANLVWSTSTDAFFVESGEVFWTKAVANAPHDAKSPMENRMVPLTETARALASSDT